MISEVFPLNYLQVNFFKLQDKLSNAVIKKVIPLQQLILK